MNQSDIIKGLRLQHNAGEPSIQYIANLKEKVMKRITSKKGFNYPLFGALTFAVIGIVVLGILFTSQGEVNIPSSVQGNPTTSMTPTATPSEKAHVSIKQVYQDVYVKSLKKYIRFNYPENIAPGSALHFSTENREDMVLVSVGGKEALTVGIDWVGWTQGDIPLMKVTKIETQNLGELYRWKINVPDSGNTWGYSMSSDVVFSGKCSVYSGFIDKAPCAKRDYVLTSKSAKTQLLFSCVTGKEEFCDTLISGFEIR